MTTLYIIGNGFDRFHGLPTNYSDYRSFLLGEYPYLAKAYEELIRLASGINEESSWSDVESALELDYEDFLEYALQSYPLNLARGDSAWHDASVFISDMIGFIEDFTGIYFYSWLNSVELNLAINEVIFKPDARFVTFNYTETLECKYKINQSNILYVHGERKNISEEMLDPINNILKYVDSSSNNYEEIEKQALMQRSSALKLDREIQFGSPRNDPKIVRDVLVKKYNSDDYFGAWIEPCIWEIEKYCKFASKNLKSNYLVLDGFVDSETLDEICVFGHSFDGVDKPYYEEILIPRFRNKHWLFVMYNEQEDELRVKSFCSENRIEDFDSVYDKDLNSIDLREH